MLTLLLTSSYPSPVSVIDMLVSVSKLPAGTVMDVSPSRVVKMPPDSSIDIAADRSGSQEFSKRLGHGSATSPIESPSKSLWSGL